MSIESVMEMLNAVIQELGELEEKEEEDLSSRKVSQAAGSGANHSIPSPKKLLFSPTDSCKVHEPCDFREVLRLNNNSKFNTFLFFFSSFLLKLSLSGQKMPSLYFRCSVSKWTP